MALEMKSLRAKAVLAAANHDKLHAAYDAFNKAAPAHAEDVVGLTKQVSEMDSDLQFAVTKLGNSVAEHEKLGEDKVVVEAKPIDIKLDSSPARAAPQPMDRALPRVSNASQYSG